MTQPDYSSRPDLVGEMRIRVPLHIAVPLVALVVIAAVVIGMARVLLSVPPEAATIVALTLAANILAACAFFAARPRLGRGAFFELLAVVIYPLIIGVAIAQVGFGDEAGHGAGAGHGAEEAPAAGGATSSVVAEGVAFDLETITLVAGGSVSLDFENNDQGTLHNIAIYESESDAQAQKNPIFDGEEITGPNAVTYQFKAPPAGEYYFHCDVHPDMNGTVVVE